MIKDPLQFEKVFIRISENLKNILTNKKDPLTITEKRLLEDENYRRSMIIEMMIFQDNLVLKAMRVNEDVQWYKFGTFRLNTVRKEIFEQKRLNPDKIFTPDDYSKIVKSKLKSTKKYRNLSFFNNKT